MKIGLPNGFSLKYISEFKKKKKKESNRTQNWTKYMKN